MLNYSRWLADREEEEEERKEGRREEEEDKKKKLTDLCGVSSCRGACGSDELVHNIECGSSERSERRSIEKMGRCKRL